MKRVAVVCAISWLAACMPSVEPIVSCQAQGNAKPLCGYQNPEDLVVLPAGHALLVSEYGGMQTRKPGVLSRLDLATEERTEIFGAAGAGSREPGWGAPECPGPLETFSPHGIDLVRRADGRLALLVVNHGERESVEFFEVLDARGAARLAWRGCSVPPEGSWLNEVAALPDGGFLVSNMMPRRDGPGQAYELLKAWLLEVESGHVIEWSPASGYSVVPGTETVFPNGVETSPDGGVVFVNSSIGDRVRGIDRRTGRLLGEAEIASPDNLAWSDDGRRLLVASLTAPTMELQACGEIEGGACPGSFEIWSLDPDTFGTELVYRSDGVTMGAGTVGLQVGGELFIGSFAGDRILRVQLEDR